MTHQTIQPIITWCILLLAFSVIQTMNWAKKIYQRKQTLHCQVERLVYLFSSWNHMILYHLPLCLIQGLWEGTWPEVCEALLLSAPPTIFKSSLFIGVCIRGKWIHNRKLWWNHCFPLHFCPGHNTPQVFWGVLHYPFTGLPWKQIKCIWKMHS